MVNILVGNLLDADAQTLVNTVNCVGVMGKGIALEFKKRFPAMHADYVRRCNHNMVRLGEPYLFRYLGGPWILNFPTKDHWRSSSRLSDIERGVLYLGERYREWEITSLAVPPLGCGNGGLDWAVVGPLLYRHFSTFDIPVQLYAPIGTPAGELTEAFLAGREAESAGGYRAFPLPPAAVALAAIVAKVTSKPMHWPIGRVTFQKIAYFATEAGLPTKLDFRRGSFGPFAPELKRMTSQLVNNGVLVERRLGPMISVRPGAGYEPAARANADVLREWKPIVDRVADLFLRIPRTSEAELAATVKYVHSEIGRARRRVTEKEIWEEVINWKRDRLQQAEVAETVRNLNLLGWIDAQYSVELDAASPTLADDPAFASG